MSVHGREPVTLIAGLGAAALIAGLAFLAELPEGVEGALQTAVAVVAGLLAAVKVRPPHQPTVFVGGLFSALTVLFTTFGIPLPEAWATSLQAATAAGMSWYVRNRVTPQEPAA